NNNRIASIAPQRIRVIQHQQNDHRHQLAEQVGTVTQLVPVDAAVPGSAAMHDLVAQGIDSIEQDPKYGGCVAVGQCELCGSPAVGKALGPLLLGDLAILVVPEALEHIGVVQQCADTAGELGPHQILDQILFVQCTELVEKCLEGGLLGKTELFIDV